MEYFAISDIHGHINKLDKLLKYWNPDKQKLVLLGDYIDRGPDSLKVLERIHHLKKNYGAVVIRGNHEDLFLGWFDYPEDPDDIYFQSTGFQTILSFLKNYPLYEIKSFPFIFSPLKVKNYIQETYPHIIQLLKDTLLYYETNRYIFVHAGFNPFLKDWKNSNVSDFMWIRNAFIYQKNETGKIAVFGHTNTYLLHNEKDNNGIWIDRWKTKVCIDGGAGSNRCLNGVVLNEDNDLSEIKVYQV